MTRATKSGFVAECFWAGVKDSDLEALDRRAERSSAELSRDGERVRYLGSVLMRQDEVVLCFFEGDASSVQRAAQRAEIPFERILESAGSPWPAVKPPREAGRNR